MVYAKVLCILAVGMALSLPAYADRGNGAFKQGVRAEHQADFDAAYKHYKEAHEISPTNAKYYTFYMQMRTKASMQHLHKGQVLRNSGALEEALKEFQRAVEIDGSSFVAQQELRMTADIFNQKAKQQSAPKAEISLSKLAVPASKPIELQPISTGPISFKMAAEADAVYKLVGKMAGINVLFDPDFRPQKIKIDLNNVTLLQALDMLRLQSKSFWQPVSPNTILVTSDSPGKRKDFEQNFMKTFYLQNISSANELQEAASVIGKILDVNRVQLLQAQDALVVRGTMDQMILVQKLLNDIDKPKSEVIIDVAVMEVNRHLIRTLGTTLPTSESIAYVPGGAAAVAGAVVNGSAINLGKLSFSVPSATVTALASDSNGRVLQNPQIRALNDEKATLRIGDRVPIATGSFAAGLGGGGVSPLVSTQFQYLDVGVNIDITPHIHANREVTLKMSLEISTVSGEVNIGGITEPQIGQRRIEHEARLADGEVNLLAGILTDSETQSMSGYPWVQKIPILKYLFAQENKDRTENEIVFAITPHVVRALEITPDNERLIEVGTGNATSLPRKSSTPDAAITAPSAEPRKPGPAAPQAPPAGVPTPSAPETPTSPPVSQIRRPR